MRREALARYDGVVRQSSMRRARVVTFFVIALTGCMSSAPEVVVGRCEPDDTRVIAATVQATSGWPPAPVFVDSVDLDAYAKELRKLDAADVPPALLRSLLERNHASSTIDPGAPAQFPLAPGAHGKTRQPIHVSLPGYSADGGAAIVYAGSACGPACGQAILVLLERSGESWKMTTVVQVNNRGRVQR